MLGCVRKGGDSKAPQVEAALAALAEGCVVDVAADANMFRGDWTAITKVSRRTINLTHTHSMSMRSHTYYASSILLAVVYQSTSMYYDDMVVAVAGRLP
jgi:azurin